MNDATSGTHGDGEAVEAERRPGAAEVDESGERPFDIDPENPVIENIDESVKRAAW